MSSTSTIDIDVYLVKSATNLRIIFLGTRNTVYRFGSPMVEMNVTCVI